MRASHSLFGLSAFGLSASLLSATPALAHNLNKKDQTFFIDTSWVERAWAEGDFRLGLDIVQQPGPSSPNPRTGFLMQLPGVRLNLYDRLELGIDFPLVVNPDALQGDIAVAKPTDVNNPETVSADFDLPSIDAYVKYSLIKDRKAKTQAAVGLEAKIGVLNHPETKAFDAVTLLRSPLLSQYEFQARPFFAGALARGGFSPQASVGLTVAQDADLPPDLLDSSGNPVPGVDIWVDWAVAVPYYQPFTEMALVVGAEGRHLLSGLSTPFDDQIRVNGGFLFGGAGPAEFGFLASVPVFSPDFRDFEIFSVRFVYSYNLQQLSIRKKPEEKKDEKKDAPATAPAPASAPTSAPAPAPDPQ